MSQPERMPEECASPTLSNDLREQALEIINAGLEEARTQHPLDIPRIFDADRPTLGSEVPIRLFRAVRLLGFREVVGSKISAAILNVSGRAVARKMGISNVQELVCALQDLSIVKLKSLEQTDDRIALSATECATCAGLPDIGETICHFETGFIAGGMENTFDGHVSSRETECWGLGDRICRWEAYRATDADASDDPAIDNLELVMTLAGKAALTMEHGLAVYQKNRELRQAYHQLRKSERLKKDLTDMVVHDMRAPLTAIMGSLETMADMMSTKLSSQEEQLLRMAFSGGQTLLNMINDLLDVSKLEQGNLICKRRDVTIAELVENALDQVRIQAIRKKIELEISVEPHLPCVPADKDRMVRVLVNLLGNAVHYTSPGGRISVQAACDDSAKAITVSISDNGEGIPQEYHGRIFDKFVQVESEKTKRRFSTGLGLTFCRLVTEAHGGRIWVESEPGIGSKFTFTLPVQ